MAKYLILLFSFSFAVVTVGPGGGYDFTTIQAAIDHVTVNPADIEIDVYPGTYEENLLIELDMIIRSVGDADNTIINGSRSTESTIVIRPQSGSPYKPIVEIDGFGIKNGKGTDVKNNTIAGSPTEKVGGGLFIYVNSPKVNNCKFENNGLNSVDKGGAVCASPDSDDIGILERDDYVVHENLEPATGVLDLSNNIFVNNDANYGHSVYIIGNDYAEVIMAGDTLDVFSKQYESASEYWVSSDYEIDYNLASGVEEAIINDVWVDPTNGIDEGNTLGDQGNPFLTINYAMSMIYPTEDNPITINLIEGTFSPSSTGEEFPIIMNSNVNLIGQGEEVTILDAEGNNENNRKVIVITSQNNVVSDLTITGGYGSAGGGIYYAEGNDLLLTNLIISENTAQGMGSGIYISGPCEINNTIIKNNNFFQESSSGAIYIDLYPQPGNIKILNSIIMNNSAGMGGGLFTAFLDSELNDIELIIENTVFKNNTATIFAGGILINYSMIPITFKNVSIYNNEAPIGAGIVLNGSQYVIFHNSVIYNNSSTDYGGGLHLLYSANINMTNTIIWNNTPESIYLLPETEEHIPNIIYSDIEDGFEGDGNIHEDPLFTDPENGDFTLMEDSPCIDAGTIIEGMEYCGDAPDMGAFEYITEDCEECPDSVEGDTNFDGTVNVLDIVIVANCILSDSCNICFDLNGDSILNILDVVVLANIILGG